MTVSRKIEYRRLRAGFSLLELLTATVICTMILITAVTLYRNCTFSADIINEAVAADVQEQEIVDLITRDIERMSSTARDIRMTIENRVLEGRNKTRLTMINQVFNSKGRPEIFEKIIWQTDYDSQSDSMILYRLRSGISKLDPLLEKDQQPEQFIPVTMGLTHFKFQVPKDEEFVDSWMSAENPPAIRVSLSYRPPVEIEPGKLEVAPEDQFRRMILVNRLRQISFKVVKKDFTIDEDDILGGDDEDDPNSVDADGQQLEDDDGDYDDEADADDEGSDEDDDEQEDGDK